MHFIMFMIGLLSVVPSCAPSCCPIAAAYLPLILPESFLLKEPKGLPKLLAPLSLGVLKDSDYAAFLAAVPKCPLVSRRRKRKEKLGSGNTLYTNQGKGRIDVLHCSQS